MSHELHTFITALLPLSCAVCLTEVTVAQQSVLFQLTASAPSTPCPLYGVPSSSIHSRYQRRLTDLPWSLRPVRIGLMVRKFVCQNPSCRRRIFTERLPHLVAPSARKTHRLVTLLQAIGIALGGNAGARLAAQLRLPTSTATLLRLVRAALVPHTPPLQAIGVDEWGWRRGHRYGTIPVDLSSHRVIDLLADCSAASVAAWLAQHPTITVVCWDRSDLYADGIRRSASEAVQVVDRFQLVQNLSQALEAVLIDRRPALQAAAVRTATALTPADGPVPIVFMDRGRRQSSTPAPQPRAEPARPPGHARWVAIYEAVHTLRVQGMALATIARQLGISRPTVYAYLRRETPPGPRRLQRRPSARVLIPYLPYLIRRWRESGANSRQLWREIRALGYAHSARTVGRFITQLRRAADAEHSPKSQGSPYTRPQGPSARAVSFAMVCPATERSREAQAYVDQLCHVDPGVAQAHGLSHAFLAMVRERRGADLEAWMAEAPHSGIEALARFARGVAGGSGRGYRRADPGMEQRHHRRPDSSPEAREASRLWEGRLRALAATRSAGGLAREDALPMTTPQAW